MTLDKKFIDQFVKVTTRAALEVINSKVSINFLSRAIKFFHLLNLLD